MIIAIDFDGTICRSTFPRIEGAEIYAKEVINRLHEKGHYIIIWTCRTGQNLLDAVNWLLEEGILFDRVNDHNPENVAKYGDGGRKVYAHCYIDDKNLGGFPGWEAAEKMITEMEDIWKQGA
ncbi:MAG TPA: HAD hydrolase family protein [Paludibacteraceae bacterium]|nr:HAD hydrolase family protein [Paludibacteraceae bacterium]